MRDNAGKEVGMNRRIEQATVKLFTPFVLMKQAALDISRVLENLKSEFEKLDPRSDEAQALKRFLLEVQRAANCLEMGVGKMPNEVWHMAYEHKTPPTPAEERFIESEGPVPAMPILDSGVPA